MSDNRYDIVVIGTGPGGEGAAMKAAKAGLRVAVVEKYNMVGGGCTHWGTIPSKALRRAIFRVAEAKSDPLLSHYISMREVNFPELVASADSIITKQVKMRTTFYERNNVDLIHGFANFEGPNTIHVDLGNGGVEVLETAHVVIATGSRPYHPPGIDFTHPCVFDSDKLLSMKYTPRTITIFGAGVIGCEYASMFRNLGCKVNLINSRDRLLTFLDDEIIDALAYHLRDTGVLLRNGEEFEDLDYSDDSITLHLQSGKRIRSDALLWANGRQGNTDGLNLEAIGIKPTSRGTIKVNANYQIEEHPHIYAVGDVMGWPSLASAAYDQGRFAATHVCDSNATHSLVDLIPTGIYTSPEISSIGKTERELTEARIPYEVGHSLFRSLARAQITGQRTGMLKLLFHRESLEILGVHCFGFQASEIIHIGQAIMSQPGKANSLEYFINTTFNYPTMAEAYRVAALNGLNRVT